jgi:hypothetical protein
MGSLEDAPVSDPVTKTAMQRSLDLHCEARQAHIYVGPY